MSGTAASLNIGEKTESGAPRKEDVDTSHPPGPSGDAPAPNGVGGQDEEHIITKLRNFLSVRRLELAMFISRLATLYFAVFAVFPFFGISIRKYTQRAFIFHAATSAIRLLQRVPPPYPMNKDTFLRVMREDSCHYFFYSLTFMSLGQVSFALVPILLLSSLQGAYFLLKVLEVVDGPQGLRSFLKSWSANTDWILRFTASSEIGLFGVIFLNCFQRKLNILSPLLYARFLALRYASRRNPNTRIVFHMMRMKVEQFMASGMCPSFFKSILRIAINLICKLAPPVAPSARQN